MQSSAMKTLWVLVYAILLSIALAGTDEPDQSTGKEVAPAVNLTVADVVATELQATRAAVSALIERIDAL